MARNTAFDEATKEFIDSLGFSKEYLLRFVRIDSIESLNDGNIKVTISIPKVYTKRKSSQEVSHEKCFCRVSCVCFCVFDFSKCEAQTPPVAHYYGLEHGIIQYAISGVIKGTEKCFILINGV